MDKECFLFDTNDKFNVSYKINEKLCELVESTEKKYERVAFICLGTDRSTGDSFGPLVGHNLSKLSIYDFDVYGTLYNPVHAQNLSETLKKIDIENTLIIAIDSSLGNYNHIGCISMGKGEIKPGMGVGKELPSVGDIFICGIVNVSGFAPTLLLQCTRLSLVYTMAEVTTNSIRYLLHKKFLTKKSITV